MFADEWWTSEWWQEVGEDWFNHHRWPDFWEDPNPAMFITGTPLTRIFPMEDLQDEITASIRQQYTQENESNSQTSAIPVFEIRQLILHGFSITNFVSDGWIGSGLFIT